jgi:glycosyltransferase involved in cell wall biosynthesis
MISVLIPAYNESNRLAETIHSLRATEENWEQIGEIVVVDDGSGDDTAVVAAASGARVIRLSRNQGNGRALTIGLASLRGEIVLLVDADLQGSAGQTLKLIEPILQGKADIAVAVFPKEKAGGGFGIARKTAQCGIKYLTGAMVEAPLSGQRAAQKQVLESILPFSEGFGLEIGMSIDALRRGYRVLEIPLDLAHCPPGKDWHGFWHRGRQFYHICRVLWAKRHVNKE